MSIWTGGKRQSAVAPRLQKIPFDGAGRLSAEYLHVAFLGHHPLLQMELLSGRGQVAAVLDRAVPIAALPAISVIKFHAAAGRIPFGDLDGSARGGRTGGADRRYERAVWLTVPVISDSPRRIACRHLREPGVRQWCLHPLQAIGVAAGTFVLFAGSMDNRDGERCFLGRNGAH